MQRVNWGIIGLGKMALKFAESFKDVKNAQLVSIASKDINRLKIFKEKFRIDNDLSFENYEELLQCQKVDIVYIALPNSHHYNWIMKCIEQKKGKARGKQFGKVEIPQEAFIGVLKIKKE